MTHPLDYYRAVFRPPAKVFTGNASKLEHDDWNFVIIDENREVVVDENGTPFDTDE